MRINEAVKAGQPYAAKLASGELKPVAHPAPHAPTPPLETAAAGLNPFLKCPLPGISVAPDSLRQFYRTGIPQRRVIAPSPLTT